MAEEVAAATSVQILPVTTGEEDKGTNSSQTKKKEEDARPKQVPFTDLFYFADAVDWVCIALGCLAGAATGVALPIFMLIFGQILDEIGKGKGSLSDAINQLAMAMAILAAIAFMVASFQVAFLSYTSARQTEKLRSTV